MLAQHLQKKRPQEARPEAVLMIRVARTREGRLKLEFAGTNTTSDSGDDGDATSSDDGGGGDGDGSRSSNVPKQMSAQTRRTAGLALRHSISKAAAWDFPPLL
jgi:hypothetical protein